MVVAQERRWFLHRQKTGLTPQAKGRRLGQAGAGSGEKPDLQSFGPDGTLAAADWHESAICRKRPQVYFRW
jgi:hypothetical protein